MNVDAIIRHAGWVLFAWVFVDQSGVPVPVVPTLVAAGALAGRGGASCAVMLAAAGGAALVAGMVWYGIGRWHGAQVLSLLGRVLHRPRVWIDHIEHAFHAHEVGFQFSAQFLPQLNPIAAGLAGATGVGLPRYIVIASAAAMAWAGTWIAVGYLLADVLADAVAYLGVWIVVLIALAVVALGAIRYARRRRSRTELVKSAALVLVIAGALSGCGGAMSEVNALSVSKVNQEEDTMPVIAILGAGPGMGLAIAKTFGARGYRVALLSRNPAKQERLVAELATHGIIAAAFRADARNYGSVASGLAAVKQRFGSIDVLEFSPAVSRARPPTRSRRSTGSSTRTATRSKRSSCWTWPSGFRSRLSRPGWLRRRRECDEHEHEPRIRSRRRESFPCPPGRPADRDDRGALCRLSRGDPGGGGTAPHRRNRAGGRAGRAHLRRMGRYYGGLRHRSDPSPRVRVPDAPELQGRDARQGRRCPLRDRSPDI